MQNLQTPTKGAHNATCRGLPPREGDSPRPSRALHCVAALEQNLPPCEAFIEAFSSNSEDIIIKFYSHPFSILAGGRVGKSTEACLLIDTVCGGLICGHFQRQEEFQQPETLFFSKVIPFPHPHPPPKKIKMYFMKLLYMKYLLAVIKWTI